MQKCYLDSNILVYFKDELSPFHQQVVLHLNSLIKQEFQFSISSLVLDEFIYAFKYGLLQKKEKRLFSELKRAMNEIFLLPRLNLVNPPLDFKKQRSVVVLMGKYHLGPRDAYHLLIMKSNQIDSFFTFDQGFKEVFANKIIKPIN